MLKRSEDTPAVVILEAREACSGATGRNGGQLKSDVYYNILKYTRKYGAERAAEFAKFEMRNIMALKRLVEEEKIDCDLVLTRTMDVYLDEEHSKATKATFDELSNIGVADLTDVEYTEGIDAQKISGVKGAKSCYSFTAGHLWPYKLVMHLLEKIVRRGVNLQTHTPVTSVSDTCDSEGRWTVTTPRGTIRTKKLIFATNGYTAAIAPQFRSKIVPVRGICSRIQVPRDTKPQTLSNTYSLRHGKGLYDYMLPRRDGSIILGGAKPSFWHDRSQWYGNTDDRVLIEPASDYFDGIMQRHFVGWEDSGAYTDHVWTGIMGWSSDFMPFVGPVPGKLGQYIIAGFSGHGMPLIHLCSEGLAGMVGGEKTFEETGMPSVFAPTEERLKSTRNEILDTPTGKL
ncbi:Gamma-glutamylputrescine oxidoreductase [Lecanosticta acicola]|uniref:Gamma-glutamylputrescine oxidoreductase n=1 Tax=Lecanosticta acicola TaxID=111012 RepID=A0AAI9EB20_9PEZI|nr:Gamma-glutamylputrescine oxidoreductase [Lecanosticta acicola]